MSSTSTYSASITPSSFFCSACGCEPSPAGAPATQKNEEVKPTEATIRTPDKQLAFVAAAQPVELRDDDPEFPALQLGSYVFGGSFKSRLWSRLREKDGVHALLGRCRHRPGPIGERGPQAAGVQFPAAG